jgi:hypothetical protein
VIGKIADGFVRVVVYVYAMQIVMDRRLFIVKGKKATRNREARKDQKQPTRDIIVGRMLIMIDCLTVLFGSNSVRHYQQSHNYYIHSLELVLSFSSFSGAGVFKK